MMNMFKDIEGDREKRPQLSESRSSVRNGSCCFVHITPKSVAEHYSKQYRVFPLQKRTLFGVNERPLGAIKSGTAEFTSVS